MELHVDDVSSDFDMYAATCRYALLRCGVKRLRDSAKVIRAACHHLYLHLIVEFVVYK